MSGVRPDLAIPLGTNLAIAAATLAAKPASSKMLTIWNCSPVDSAEIEAKPILSVQNVRVRVASVRVQLSSKTVGDALSLNIPPPTESAELPEKVQLVSSGEE